TRRRTAPRRRSAPPLPGSGIAACSTPCAITPSATPAGTTSAGCSTSPTSSSPVAMSTPTAGAPSRRACPRSGTPSFGRARGGAVGYVGKAAAAVGSLDSRRSIGRRGSAAGGARGRAALGAGRVELQLDSARLLDASVLLGADFGPSPRRRLDFHP